MSVTSFEVCPECGAVWSGDECIDQRCYACGWRNENQKPKVKETMKMAAKSKKNAQPTEPFLDPIAVKDVPQSFEGAAALGLEAGRAVKYWQEQQRYAMTTERKYLAKTSSRRGRM